MINNASNTINETINLNVNQSFANTFTTGTYYWKINCKDYAGNEFNSSERIFSMTAVVSSSSSGGGGGAGVGISSVGEIFEIDSTQASNSYTKDLKKNDKIKFTFFDEKLEEHSLSVSEIIENSVTILIQSEPITIKLGIGQSAKLNLTSSEYYDIYVRLNSIVGNSASVTIQTIHEEISKAPITGDSIDDINRELEDIGEIYSQISNLKTYIYVLVVIIILIIIYLFWKGLMADKKKSDRKKHIIGLRERFRKSIGRK